VKETDIMPSLLIQLINNQWVAEVANTNIRYQFIGNTVDVQTQAVQFLAGDMMENGGNLAEFNRYVGRALDIGNVDADVVTQQLYAATDTLVYEGRPIYASLGDEMLIDELAEAGQALCMFLGML
jgi:hypothetical protein